MAHDFGATYSEMESAAARLRDGRSTVTDTLKELQGVIDDLVQDGFKTENASEAYSTAYSELTTSLDDAAEDGLVTSVWRSLGVLHRHQISHGDLRRKEITVDGGKTLFGGFGNSEYGASDEQLQSDIAQLLMTTTDKFGAEAAVRAAIDALDKDTVLTASRRLTKSALPKRIRSSVDDPKALMTAARDEVKKQTGADKIQPETITRFSRKQLIQTVLLVALVYVAYPFISTVPTFFNELGSANWWWALLGLTVSALTYVGAAAALWASADGVVSFRNLVIMQFANTFAATTTPATPRPTTPRRWWLCHPAPCRHRHGARSPTATCFAATTPRAIPTHADPQAAALYAPWGSAGAGAVRAPCAWSPAGATRS